MATNHLVKAVVLVKRRQKRKASARKAFAQRLLHIATFALGVVSLAAAFVALAALPVYLSLTQNLPEIDRLPAYFDPIDGQLLRLTRLLDRTGQESLFSLHLPEAPRAFVDAISNPFVAAAFVASQEPEYWTTGHSWSFAATPEGIAEEFVARRLLADELDGWPKTIRTRLLAAQAVKTYGRGQILNWALNSAGLGHWTFGIESAAQLYLGKGTAELSLGEAALLAAVAQAPALNPFDAPELAVAYQRLVLGSMRDQGIISENDFIAANETPLSFAMQPETGDNWLTEVIIEELDDSIGIERIQLGDLEVVTSIDAALQLELEALTQGSSIDVIVIDPLNGHILAMSENAIHTPHNANEALLPFTYLETFAEGDAPASLVWLRGRPTTLRAALASGEPFGATFALNEKLVETLGFQAEDGDLSGTVLNIASAYGTLINGYLPSHNGNGASTLLFASDAQGRVLLNHTTPNLEAITSPELAYLVTDVLTDASVRDETVDMPSGRSLAYFAAENWIVGYSPQRVVAVWTESDDDGQAIWSAIFEAAHRNLPLRNWDIPANLNSVVVCVPSGQLPDEDCPETRREWYLIGTEPTQNDNLFQRIAINSLNGDLATVFTPQEFVIEKIFAVPPAGIRSVLERPPEDYDPIPAFAGQNNPVTIAGPILFANVDGIVEIAGIMNTGATHYDIQVGQGLWPSEWMLVADGRAPVNRRISVDWDTAGLTGLWAIQLQAWDADGVLARTYTVVTIEE